MIYYTVILQDFHSNINGGMGNLGEPDRRTGNFAASVFILIGTGAAPVW